jgi:hypothetical protein
MEATQHHRDMIARLRALGLKIAIDDFGTSYSTLNYLTNFPVDRIKIAQELIFWCTTEIRHAAVVRAAIHLAQELNRIACGRRRSGGAGELPVGSWMQIRPRLSLQPSGRGGASHTPAVRWRHLAERDSRDSQEGWRSVGQKSKPRELMPTLSEGSIQCGSAATSHF